LTLTVYTPFLCGSSLGFIPAVILFFANMVSSKFSLVATAVAALAPLVSAFDASSRSNLAIYYVRFDRSIRLGFQFLHADH
jgi:predicted membrane protein